MPEAAEAAEAKEAKEWETVAGTWQVQQVASDDDAGCDEDTP